jgi:hypothetical protein
MKTPRDLARTAAVTLMAAGLAAAQQVQGPVMGFVVDGDGHRIRPILGVPGAAVVGNPIDTGVPVTVEAVSPVGNYAMVRGASDRNLAIWTAGGGVQALTGLPPAAYRVALSPEGTAAAFYSAADNSLRVISGLPAAPSSVSEIPLSSLAAGLQKFAVSDDGQVVLCAEASTDAGAAAVVLGHSGELNRITYAGPITAVAFAGRSHDAVVASGTAAFLVGSVEVPGSTTVVDAGDFGAISSAALAADGRHVLLAGADSGKIAVLGLTSGEAPVVMDCNCTPEGLFRINGGAYRLGGYDGATIRILDTAATPPRILVIPSSLHSDNSK